MDPHAAPFQPSHCLKCLHSSAQISNLWQRISELEGNLYQASIEKTAAQAVLKSLLDFHTNTEHQLDQTLTERLTAEIVVQALLRWCTGNSPLTLESILESSYGAQYGKLGKGISKSMGDSLSSDDTLIQFDQEENFSAPEYSTVKGAPFVDLLGSCETDSTFESSASEPLVPQAAGEGKERGKSSAGPHHYIHHFKENALGVPEHMVADAKRSNKIANKKRTMGGISGETALPDNQPPYTSSDEADSEGSSNPSKYASANTSFSDPYVDAESGMSEDAARSGNLATRNVDDVSCPNHGHLQAIPEVAEQSTEPQELMHAAEIENVGALKADPNVDVASYTDRRPLPRASGVADDLALRYIPKPTDLYVYRTVVISGLSPKCSLTQLLDKVSGGLVVRALLADTTSLTGTKSAYVSFFEERYAVAYEAFVKANVVEVDGQRISATLIATPTWPLSLSLRRSIREQRRTRCLAIEKFPRDITPSSLRKDLELHPALDGDDLEHMTLDPKGTLQLRFSSIMAAQQAYSNLFLRLNRKCAIRFAPDPCDKPLFEGFT